MWDYMQHVTGIDWLELEWRYSISIVWVLLGNFDVLCRLTHMNDTDLRVLDVVLIRNSDLFSPIHVTMSFELRNGNCESIARNGLYIVW